MESLPAWLRPPLPSPGNTSDSLWWDSSCSDQALAQPSMIKLTQQQEFELPLRIPLVALELPLDLLVDPHLLRVFA